MNDILRTVPLFLSCKKEAYKTIPDKLSISLCVCKYMLNKRNFENRATFFVVSKRRLQNDT